MSRVVLDASALLVILFEEPGWESVVSYLDDAVMSAVNVAEVQSRLVRGGVAGEEAWESATQLVDDVVAFDLDQARAAGELVRITQPFGLSLGDRACLALAGVLGIPAVTVDRAWAEIRCGTLIHVVR